MANTETTSIRRQLELFPNLVPLSIQPHPRSNLFTLDKSRFLVNGDLKLMDVKTVIRSRLKLNKTESLFLYIGESKRLCNDSFIIC